MAENEKETKLEQPDVTQGEDPVENPMERFFYHQRRALEETGKALEALLPPDFRSHAGEASKEFAKGFSVLVDVAIDELKKVSEREDEDETVKSKVDIETEDDDDEPPTTGKTKVRVKLD